MREVEALKDYLLHLFNQDRQLTPKDIVVMVADIDRYTPYIRAVFWATTSSTFLPNTYFPFPIINCRKMTLLFPSFYVY